jgi:hypothetical protein
MLVLSNDLADCRARSSYPAGQMQLYSRFDIASDCLPKSQNFPLGLSPWCLTLPNHTYYNLACCLENNLIHPLPCLGCESYRPPPSRGRVGWGGIFMVCGWRSVMKDYLENRRFRPLAMVWFDRLTMIGKNPFALSLSKGVRIAPTVRLSVLITWRNPLTLNETPPYR